MHISTIVQLCDVLLFILWSQGQGARAARTSSPSKNCRTKKIAKEPKSSLIAKQKFGPKCLSKDSNVWSLAPKDPIE